MKPYVNYCYNCYPKGFYHDCLYAFSITQRRYFPNPLSVLRIFPSHRRGVFHVMSVSLCGWFLFDISLYFASSSTLLLPFSGLKQRGRKTSLPNTTPTDYKLLSGSTTLPCGKPLLWRKPTISVSYNLAWATADPKLSVWPRVQPQLCLNLPSGTFNAIWFSPTRKGALRVWSGWCIVPKYLYKLRRGYWSLLRDMCIYFHHHGSNVYQQADDVLGTSRL